MNKIHTPRTNQQDETPAAKKEVITENTASSLLEEGLSQSPLTTDQKIEQLVEVQSKLTAEVRNLSLGLNQMMELSKILMKNQLESANAIEKVDVFAHHIDGNIDALAISVKEGILYLDKKITEATKITANIQKEANEKSFSNQRKIALGVEFIVDKLTPEDGYYERYKKRCRENLESVGG